MFTKTVKNVLITSSLIGATQAMEDPQILEIMKLSLKTEQEENRRRENIRLEEERLEKVRLYEAAIVKKATELNIDPVKYEQLFKAFRGPAKELNMNVHEYIKMRLDAQNLERGRLEKLNIEKERQKSLERERPEKQERERIVKKNENPQNRTLLTVIDPSISDDPIKRTAWKACDGIFRGYDIETNKEAPFINAYDEYWITELYKRKNTHNNHLHLANNTNIKFVLEDSSFDGQILDQFLELKPSGVGFKNDFAQNNCMLYSIIRDDVDLLAKILGSRGEAQALINIKSENDRDYDPVRKAIMEKAKTNLDTKYLETSGTETTLREYLGGWTGFRGSLMQELAEINQEKGVEDTLTFLGNSHLMLEVYFANVISVLYNRPVYVLTPATIDMKKDTRHLIPMNDYRLVMPDRQKQGQDAIFIYHEGNGGIHYSKLIPINLQ